MGKRGPQARPGRRTQTIQVRVEPDLLRWVAEEATVQAQTVSGFVREALIAYSDQLVRKRLAAEAEWPDNRLELIAELLPPWMLGHVAAEATRRGVSRYNILRDRLLWQPTVVNMSFDEMRAATVALDDDS